MQNQINVGIQRQPYEPFEPLDSDTENQNADASLADDSAGANTGGDAAVVSPPIEGESINAPQPETSMTNSMLHRYGIGDGIILQRPEYAINNRAAPAAIPTSVISAPARPSEATPICPVQTDPGSSGLETAALAGTKSIEKADVTPSGKPSINSANRYNLNAAPAIPRDCADYKAALAFGAAHGYSEIKTEKFAAMLYYQDPRNRIDYCDSLQGSPEQISIFLDLVPTNADGTFNLALAQRIMDERFRAPAFPDDPDAGNRNQSDGRAAGFGGVDIPRAGAGQGDQDYANEMTMASPTYGHEYDYAYNDDAAFYDSNHGADNTPAPPDFNPLPSLPPVDTNGPIMLPPPDIRVDPVLAPLPNISVADPFQQTAGNTSVGNSSGNNLSGNVGANEFNNADIGDPSQQSGGNTNTPVNTNAGGGATNLPLNDDAPDEEISLTPEEEAGLRQTSIEIGPLRVVSTPATPPKPEGQRVFMGLNADGEPIYSSSSLPPQGEYRAAPDAPSLIAGDPALRADASGATPLRDESGTLYYRVNGGAMDGQIIHVRPTTSSPQIEQPATTLEAGGTVDRSGDALLGFAPLATGSTATSSFGARLASEVLAAEMRFGPPPLRAAAAATLTGAALWAAGRNNTDYEALSPEERDALRQPLINVPPPPLPPFPGLVPPPVPDNSMLPGTSTQPNNLPPLGGFQIAPPRTIDDLIIESSRAPNGSTRANGYDYEFDGNSRIDNVEGDLDREDGTRNRTHQSGAGGADRLPDDDGGHIVGNRFNPPGEEFNYVAQNSNFNRGSYRQLENEWAQLLADGHTVHVRWDFEYSGDSQRPDGFNVTYHVDDGEPVVRQFQNRHGGK